ncbi:squamous cell carcinoma antigen recognized by T-cells 3-like [Photinus pyralis]|uniref:squamous cell carcinoma antigen recognized by T-cells 3-like n=1 Tax=Photinus pyralis TaxID=7054 RepID=UPI001267419C|nr:squamous cell carcinoma antigen recognized by T-cells 3-like [Photinus pyralis]
MGDNDKMVTSDDDELSSSDGEDKELEDRATALEGELANNKYLYEVHLEVVEIYRKLGDIKSMREAYNRFSEYFPLTSTIWLAWIKDEVKLATSSSEKKHVLTLFERAVKDYLCKYLCK